MPANDTYSASWDQMAVVGRVARPHGNRGELIINLETDFPARRFKHGNVVYARIGGETQSFRIAAVRFHAGGRPVVTLGGIESMGEAESMAALELRVPESELMPLPRDTYYRHQLMGCLVETIAGTMVGTVTAVQGSTGAFRLLVRPSSGAGAVEPEIEVPLAEPICVHIDVGQRRIVVDPPVGLLALNQRR